MGCYFAQEDASVLSSVGSRELGPAVFADAPRRRVGDDPNEGRRTGVERSRMATRVVGAVSAKPKHSTCGLPKCFEDRLSLELAGPQG